MATEIRVGGLLLASACEKCKGRGWIPEFWRHAAGLTGVGEVKCDDCKGKGLLLTNEGNEMRKFVELINMLKQ